MKIQYPTYYNRFECLAGECPDTCCRGWEIDIDEDTFYYYQVQEGSFGEKLRKELREEGECKFIATKEDGRCPFLTKENLCEIYCCLGEEALSRTCQEYPRYYMGVGEYEQVDLSLSCKEVGRLLFTQEGKITYTVSEDEEEPWGKQDSAGKRRLQAILSCRDRLIAELQSKQGEKIAEIPAILPDTSLDEELLYLFERMEILDVRTAKLLEEIKGSYETLHLLEEEFRARYDAQLKKLFTRFAVYLVFRYTIDAYYEDEEDHTSTEEFSLIKLKRLWSRSLRLLFLMCLLYYSQEKTFGIGPMIELSHLYSRQVEHSDENLELFKNPL